MVRNNGLKQSMKKLTRRKFIKLCSGTAASLGFSGPAIAVGQGMDPTPIPPDHPLPPAGSFLRFDEIILYNHRNFRGFNSLRFEPARTEIIGPNGSGKTTIAKLLASDNPEGDEKSHVSVQVYPEGCEGVLRHYRELIHVGDDRIFRTKMLKRLTANPELSKLEERATGYFQRLIPNARTFLNDNGLFEVLREDRTESDTQVAAAFSILLAERDTVNYRLPLVLNNPFSSVDSHLRRAFTALLAPLETQIILLCTEHHMRSSGWPSSYVLDRIPGLRMQDWPAHIPHSNTHELRRTLYFMDCCNRYILA